MFHFTRELKKKNMWKMVKAIIVKIKKIAFQYAFINMVKEEEPCRIFRCPLPATKKRNAGDVKGVSW